MGVLAKESEIEKDKKSLVQWETEFDANDPSGTVKLIEQRTRYALKRETPWRNEAKQDFNFALGDQWTAEERQLLREQGRPCLTFNKIEPLIDLVGGWQRENSMRIRIFPEGGEDRIFSEIGDRCVKHIDKVTKLNYKIDHQFDDGIICGKGWLEMAISYDKNVVNGDLIFRNDTIYQILRDPDGKEYDCSDWEYIIKLTRYTKSKLKKMYPDKKEDIDNLTVDNTDYILAGDVLKEGDADNYHLGKDIKEVGIDKIPGVDEIAAEKYLLKEMWHRKYITKYFIFDVNTNRLDKFDKEEEANAKKDEILKDYNAKFEKTMQEYQLAKNAAMAAQMATGQQGQLPPEPTKEDDDRLLRVFSREISEMWYAAETAGSLLQDDSRSPFAPSYEGFPIFPYYAKWYVSAEDDKISIKGITRNVKDANKEVNKSRSQFLHIINTIANSGWVGDKDALTSDGWRDLKKMGSTPGVIIKKKKGSELTRIEPAGTNMSNIIRGDKAEDDIKQISGINPDALAMQDKTTSGRAISLRIKQALTILAKYFRNFRYTKELVGTAIFAVIPEILDIATIRKILGEDFMAKNKLDDGVIKSFLAQIRDGKYNMNITEADNTATIRQETFEDLLELAKSGYPIPPDVMLEFSAIPNAKEIIERVKEYVNQQANIGTATKSA